MTVALEYRSATIGYDAPVVSEVSLAVPAGEFVGLIGPNGAGKTTLLRAVTGGAAVLVGDVSVSGQATRSYSRSELARLVGVLPQATSQSFAFTARQFVEMGRHARVSRFGTLGPDDRTAVDRALALTDTEALSGEPVDTLSGGDLQRLTLAQALAQEPQVLLLDEPTSHLDLNHRLQVLDVVRRLADDGMAVLAVFHDLDMAARYADRLGVVAGGTLREADTPARVLTAETLSDVFGVRAVIGADVVTGAVQVTPVVREQAPAPSRGVSVLVISGSGAGAAVMRTLVLDGFDVASGALAIGDVDLDVATALGVSAVDLPPYGGMSEDDESAVARRAAESDAVVVCATPFGRSNVGNLRAVAGADRPTVLVGTLSAEDDFTGGAASALWKSLIASGARACADPRAVVRCVEEVLDR